MEVKKRETMVNGTKLLGFHCIMEEVLDGELPLMVVLEWYLMVLKMQRIVLE